MAHAKPEMNGTLLELYTGASISSFFKQAKPKDMSKSVIKVTIHFDDGTTGTMTPDLPHTHIKHSLIRGFKSWTDDDGWKNIEPDDRFIMVFHQGLRIDELHTLKRTLNPILED